MNNRNLVIGVLIVAALLWANNTMNQPQPPPLALRNITTGETIPRPITTTTASPATRPDRDLITAATSRNWTIEEHGAFYALRSTYFPGASDREIRDTMYSACEAAGAFNSGEDFVVTAIMEYPELAERMGAVLGVLYAHNFCATTHQWRMIQEAGDYLGFGG